MADTTTTISADTLATLCTVLQNQLRSTKRAYYAGMPGITYDDMAAAATRLINTRAMYEQATGRPVRSKPTKKAIATLLRSI